MDTAPAQSLRSWSGHLAGPLPERATLPRIWSKRFTEAPRAPLWWSPQSGQWWSGERFDEATRRAAGSLADLGVGPGDRLLWSCSSSVEAIAVHVAALRSGVVVVPVNPGYSGREVRHIVDDARPVAVVADDPERFVGLPGARPGNLPPSDRVPARWDEATGEDPALIGYTSGTTGAPKGAVLTHDNLAAATQGLVAAWRWTAEDRLVHALPIFHAHGLCVGLYGTLTSGASAVLLPGFDPTAVGEAARVHGATMFFGVPTMYHRLVADRPSSVHSWRLCASGSAPMSAELHRRASEVLGTQILERYGMTETLMNTSNPYVGERRAGSVGFPLPEVEAMVDPSGEILVRGPHVMAGYWQRPAANEESFRPDDTGGPAWFRTGDLGHVDDGYLVIQGRAKELIISGGYNVYPAEVEDVLMTYPGVVEVVVTGTPSDEWGEVVTAWMVMDGDLPTADQIAGFCASRLAGYKRPRLVRAVDALPRNALGKIVRSELGGR
jgi:malonyl-CoA/methylmalonyl-CoA synthetase